MEKDNPSPEQKFLPIALHIGLQAWVGAACEEGVSQCLESGAPTNLPRPPGSSTHTTPLHAAAYLSHPGIIARLLASDACINEKNHHGFTPLHRWAEGVVSPDMSQDLDAFIASKDQCIESGALLLIAGADPDAKQDGVPSVRQLLIENEGVHWLLAAQALASASYLQEGTPPLDGGESPRRL